MPNHKSAEKRVRQSEKRRAINRGHRSKVRTYIKKLRAIAAKLVDCALEGQSWAIDQVASRLDGKPAQEISLDATVTHDLADLTDGELAERIKRELGALAGRGKETTDQGKLH